MSALITFFQDLLYFKGLFLDDVRLFGDSEH